MARSNPPHRPIRETTAQTAHRMGREAADQGWHLHAPATLTPTDQQHWLQGLHERHQEQAQATKKK